MSEPTTPMSGRRAQAARNDEVILTAAREVFLDDPDAPVAAVADRAGVGISALYRRYPSKEALLRKLCADGLAAYIGAAQAAVAALAGTEAGTEADTEAGTGTGTGTGTDGGAWAAFATFMRRVVDAGSTSLTRSLAGKFTPDQQLYRDATLGDQLNQELLARLRAAGAIRGDVEVADIGLILEQIAAVKLGDERRTAELRHRYLALYLDALRPQPEAGGGGALPGPPPTVDELAARWRA